MCRLQLDAHMHVEAQRAHAPHSRAGRGCMEAAFPEAAAVTGDSVAALGSTLASWDHACGMQLERLQPNQYAQLGGVRTAVQLHTAV